MVDFAASVDDTFLERCGAEKGERRVVTVEERADILETLDGSSYQVSAGGSLSNTLVAIARLGAAEHQLWGSGLLKVAMGSVVGSDPLGKFYCAQLRQAGVEILTEPQANSNTGTVVVLTTPDANRTMQSYLGTPQELPITAFLEDAICRSRVLVIEGYLWEMPNARESILTAIAGARRSGTLVALTAGDSGLITRHRDDLWAALDAGADILFTNRGEAAALLDRPGCSAEDAALALGPHCGTVVVTDGANGSYMCALGQLSVVPPHWATEKPVDTCGAGDAYAAGLLYGLLSGYNVTNMGRAGARVASTVISKFGAALTPSEALQLANVLPALEYEQDLWQAASEATVSVPEAL
ncbi:hypothetical protein WJX72_001343 [[Myrmecia] bisecta]|uniref:Carbohydrate kinase PfkB domain-containing protein n=1 Tax=[Myrmecia] bisecta TaxID=41462 RepID=A0AAW1P4W0_9CHLO